MRPAASASGCLPCAVLLGCAFWVIHSNGHFYSRDDGYSRAPARDPNIVYTPYGIIHGRASLVRGVVVRKFFGIPYAQPPLKTLRFRKPKPLPWKKSRYIRATSMGPSCPQTSYYFDALRNNNDLHMSEDCLYLNVWTAQFKPLRPVVVLIHGGFFTHGGSESPMLDMSQLTTRGVVCVSFNYRLNAFGFLYAGVAEAAGNVGLYDQQLALQWVKKHIRYFGGDPNRITVMGQGAGAVATAYHLLNSVSQKLFRRAILQSGNPFSIMNLNQRSVAMTRASTIAKRLGCSKDDDSLSRTLTDVVLCMLAKDARLIAKAAELEFTRGVLSLLPLLDAEGFLKKSPEKLLYDGRMMSNVEVLMGAAKDGFADSLYYAGYFDAGDEILPGDVKYLVGLFYGTFFRANAVPILRYYFRDAANSTDLIRSGGHAIADGVLICPGNEFAEEMASLGAKVYYYSFDHTSTFTRKEFGVTSAEETLYSLGSLHGPVGSRLAASLTDLQFADDMVDLIATFVYYGRAYSPKSDADWPPYSAEKPFVAHLKANVTVSYGPRLEECNFWSYFWNNYDASIGQTYSHVILG
ncbi:cholinesterase-like [Tropilaelaps mercedesae]|uniref:Cholinesterase-like n=1 Tax=Tropilaelaps mercedesae TaxID=418985 RepID=A0A1V9XC03_9ACAR|nr:cholinesterase-like [Tropilaelaps mercedesae]